ncbi:hypothetical protein E3U23_13530 [Erythrobacter litoralis]|uniref:hypothetical protein n=1 Tax=Erythrobacter litoralis TaxID=39960 RepID=UPI002435C1E0|nr:hypothetical protein [Erythrobacter litoralis]MDG6080211.1 hypothetical protein [Erythrobacter litoralis]
MTRGWLLAGAGLVLTSSVVLAQRAPESILPPGFEQPAPTPSPTPAPSPASAPAPSPSPSGGEVVQPLPSTPSSSAPTPPPRSQVEEDLASLPSARELELMNTDELDELLGLKPKVDIPPAAQRTLDRVGIIGTAEGGLPGGGLARQPAALVQAAIVGIEGPLVSRWGHILLRRTLASRLAAPQGLDPAAFAAMRANLLNRLGEHDAARALVQSVDNADYTPALVDAALASYMGTADIVGACPVVRRDGMDRDDTQWNALRAICNAYAGEETRAQNDLRRLLSRTSEDRIDVFLAQRFAGAAGRGRRAVTIEWDGVDALTPWRFALAHAVGEPIPDGLSENMGDYYLQSSATLPMLTPLQRVRGANLAASRGILSSQAFVDLYSQLYAQQTGEEDRNATSLRLRDAYVAAAPSERVAAIRAIWDGSESYGEQVLTAYAAARVTPSEAFADDAGTLIGSMLTAGLDRNALRWQNVVAEGTIGWALLSVAVPNPANAVSDGELDSFADADMSSGQRKAKMLVAGLAGLGRIDDGNIAEYSDRLGLNLTSQTRFTNVIDRAAAVNNKALVALLAGLGMQGESWDRMTARQLYHIVAALNRVGLNAEARMIAAEAVFRA